MHDDSEKSLTEAMNFAMRSLASKESGERELADRLLRQGVDEAMAAEVVARCKASGWVDDARYAGMLVRSLARRHYGPLKVRFELRRKGITGGQAETALEAEDIDWFTLAADWLARKGAGSDLSDSRVRAKLARALLGRGFVQDQVRHALDELKGSSSHKE
ncbi:regulatory protein RecX [Aeromonas schubertii]|uniref:regulatory protein RecX n=1 Tax=Aeromonas schubertii TaxID=652 RepID=UPI001CC6DE4B|nr:regulatory protein RecX [Aeromonas schubertii]MBZ6072524.1 recombination regulator RecX [Aeromonas schubertii]